MAVPVDAAFAALPCEAGRLYRALGACTELEFIDAPTAAALLGCAPPGAVGLLNDLAKDGLLAGEGPGGRYRLADTAHARQLASADPVIRVRTRLRDYMLASATEAERLLSPSHRSLSRDYTGTPPPAPWANGDEQAALGWLAAQRPNLMALARTSVHEQPAYCWQLVDAMWPEFLRHRGTEEWIEAHRLGERAAAAAEDWVARGRMLTSGSNGLRNAGQLSEALAWTRQALDLYTAHDDPRGRGQALHQLGLLHATAGDHGPARESYLAALALRKAIGYERGAALTCRALGELAANEGDLDKAAELLRRSVIGLVEADDPYDAAHSRVSLARLLSRLGAFDGALAQLDQARAGFVATGSAWGLALALDAAGGVHARLGDTAAARAAYTDALALDVLTLAQADRVRARLADLPEAP